MNDRLREPPRASLGCKSCFSETNAASVSKNQPDAVGTANQWRVTPSNEWHFWFRHMPSSLCPSARECGGCPWIDAGPSEARRIREDRLRAELQRSLGPSYAVLPIVWNAQPRPQGYRRRIRLQIDADGGVGFFNPSKYRQCAALTPTLRALLNEFLDESRQRPHILRFLRHLELREPDLEGRPGVYFAKRDPHRSLSTEIRDELQRWLQQYRFAVADDSLQIPSQRLALDRLWQYVPVSSFLQINAAVNQRLVQDLVAQAQARQLESFCDLYAGSGNFALPLLAAGLHGCGVEIDGWACAAAERAAVEQSILGHEFIARDAGEFVNTIYRSCSYDLVIIDPPRAGVRQHLAAMAQLCRHSLVYCSCNIRSLARDLAILLGLGFAIDSVCAYDMFEHTDHLETVVWLHRS